MSSALKLAGASLKVKLTVAVSPDLRALTLLLMVTAGASVSTTKVGDAPALPVLP